MQDVFCYRCIQADLMVNITILVVLFLVLLKPIPVLSELSVGALYLTICLSGDLALWGNLTFLALCPSGIFAHQTTLLILDLQESLAI